MKISLFFFLFSCIIVAGLFSIANALPYDYTATIECLETPHKAQYGGGMVVNPEFDDGSKGWSTFGNANVAVMSVNTTGNRFIVARGRTKSFDGVSQEFHLHKDMLYTFSAWVQVNKVEVPVSAVFRTVSGYKFAGTVVAEPGCWSMLKGGLTVEESGPAKLYFESNNTSAEIWVDSISLQPFTREEWASHQVSSIEKNRKGNVRIQAVDSKGKPLINASIKIRSNQMSYPIGCAMNQNILKHAAYQNWFKQRFRVTTFENEMKWYSTEREQGKEDYSVADRMMQFAKQNGVAVRGHTVFWDDPQYQQWWVKSLSPAQLWAATEKRITSLLGRYKGQVIAWDVVNENLHFNFFESKLGAGASATFYKRAHQLDWPTTMFLNEYNTIESSGDGAASPAKYKAKLREIQYYSGRTGIGLEGHFSTPNLPYMRSAIDILAATGHPIWLTEVDVQSHPNQAWYLEQVLREGHAHPTVEGIVIWAAWSPEGCYRMCLTDNNFRNLPTGDVVDKLLREWGGHTVIEAATDGDGFYETSLFHGDYDVSIIHSGALNSSFTQQSLKVAPTDVPEQRVVQIQTNA